MPDVVRRTRVFVCDKHIVDACGWTQQVVSHGYLVAMVTCFLGYLLPSLMFYCTFVFFLLQAAPCNVMFLHL